MALNYEKTRGIINFIKAGGATNFLIREKFGYEMGGEYSSFNSDMDIIKNSLRLLGYDLIVERVAGNTYSYSVKNIDGKTILDEKKEPEYDKKSLFKEGCKAGLHTTIFSNIALDFGKIIFNSYCDFFFLEIGDELKTCIDKELDYDVEMERIWNEKDIQEALI